MNELARKIRIAFEKKGYLFFENGKYNLNIVGIRSRNNIPEKFDDKILVIYKDTFEREQVKVFKATTDPGLYYLKNLINVKGTAILAPGQHKSAFQLGMHRGKERALVQLNKLPVIRDNNRDGVLDFSCKNLDLGFHGIHVHSAGSGTEKVGRWSAGCQVIQEPVEYRYFISLCEEGAKHWGNTFTYTLLEEGDLV